MKKNTTTALATALLTVVTLIANAQYCTSSLYSSVYYNNPAQDKAIDSVAIPEAGFGNYSLGLADTLTRYVNNTNVINLTMGKSYTLIVKAEAWSSISAWIDYNQNSVFDSTEWIQVTSNNSFCPIPCVVTFTVPFSNSGGLSKIRIRTTDDTFGNYNLNSANQSCSTFGVGETEDYVVNIIEPSTYCFMNLHNVNQDGSIDTVQIMGTTFFNAAPGYTNNIYTGYSVFNTTTANLAQGSTYSIVVKTSSQPGFVSWIDFNKNNIFDSIEMVFSNYNINNFLFINVPNDAKLGNTTMRIRAYYTGICWLSPCSITACESAGGGETEDYQINIVAPTSVEKLNTTNVKAYPNPTTGLLTIALPTNEVASYQVFNSIGQLVINGTFIDNKIDLSAYKNGTYTLRVITSNGVSTQRIVKQ